MRMSDEKNSQHLEKLNFNFDYFKGRHCDFLANNSKLIKQSSIQNLSMNFSSQNVALHMSLVVYFVLFNCSYNIKYVWIVSMITLFNWPSFHSRIIITLKLKVEIHSYYWTIPLVNDILRVIHKFTPDSYETSDHLLETSQIVEIKHDFRKLFMDPHANW